MNTPHVFVGEVVMRRWTESGLNEHFVPFHTLDELYAHCLRTSDNEVVDRIIVQGRDPLGNKRVVTFVFQSITVSSERGSGLLSPLPLPKEE